MACPHFDRLKEIIWPSPDDRLAGEAYALLDAARDSRIYHTLRRSSVDSCCLYSGTLPRAIEEVAPYLVALARDSDFTRQLFDLTWGNSAAIFLTSSAFLQDLRRHLRRLLTVEDEDGRKLIFRFYDPRVLRVYLPTCNEEELRLVFGPVDRYVVEGSSPGILVAFRRAGGGLTRDTFELGDSAGAQHA
jgi:hypothetical protein